MRNLILLALLVCSTMAKAERPIDVEVLETLVREAPSLTAVGTIGSAPSEDAAVTFIVTVLYELGVFMPQSEDTGSLTVSCEEEDGGWACNVIFGIRWSDAESAHVVRFVLDPIDAECGAVDVETLGAFRTRCWTIRDQVIEFMHFG